MRQEKKDCCKETANLLYERSFLYGVIRGGVIMLVSEIMTKDVITVQPNASIREIAECLVEKRISGVPVVDGDGRVVGIVSEGDLMRKEIAPDLPDGLCILGAVIYYNGLREYREAFRKMAAQKARHIMTKEVVSVHAEDDVTRVAKIMYDKHVKRVPVLDGAGMLIGIVSRRDIVKMFL